MALNAAESFHWTLKATMQLTIDQLVGLSNAAKGREPTTETKKIHSTAEIKNTAWYQEHGNKTGARVEAERRNIGI